jgi:nucleoside phosphorylase
LESRGLVPDEWVREVKSIGLVVPTRWEAGPILRHLKMRLIAKNLFGVKQKDQTVWLRISGVGRENARQAADRLCVNQTVDILASVGFCGALVPTLKVGDIIRDRMVTVDIPAKTPLEREALTQRANAVAVDMETQAVIEAGTLRGVPIRILRVISDQFADDLTPLFGSGGEFSPLKIALRLLNPSVWPLAARLRRQSAMASRQLIIALDAWLENPL